MRKLMFVAAVVSGVCWYVANYVQFPDPLAYAHKNPQASWAPTVDYYVGMAHYVRSEYPKSQEAFTQLLTDYSTGPYTAKGLLRLASAAEENRDFAVARQSLQRFIEEFPDHKDKRVAEARLEMIKFK